MFFFNTIKYIGFPCLHTFLTLVLDKHNVLYKTLPLVSHKILPLAHAISSKVVLHALLRKHA